MEGFLCTLSWFLYGLDEQSDFTPWPCYCRPPLTDAQPTDAEREVWEQVDVVLKDAKGILDELQAYKGAGQEIREVQLIQTWRGNYNCSSWGKFNRLLGVFDHVKL